jgi:predicted nucleic acid-binding protein
MTVVDASVMVELLLRMPGSERLQQRLARPKRLCAPALLDVEVAQALRRYAARGELSAERGTDAIELLLAFPIVRYGHEPLLSRVWQLRANLTAYDATYVALAEALRVPLLTADERLANAPGHRARVEVV